MACQAFTVLYTHQKTKKAKVWQDGILKTLPEGRKATLYDDKGQRLESVFFKVDKLNPGDDLESDRYLITVEAEHVESSKSQKAIESKVAPNFNRNVPKSVGLRPPAGLKRKFTGFQCPREVSKKPLLEVDGMAKASSPVLAQSYSSLPSQLYTTSPLFAAPLTKQQEAVLLADSSVETWKNNYVTVQSPLPTTCLTSQKKTMETENMASTTHVGGGSITQNIRSTAQILALLKAQPLLLKNGVVCAEAGQQQYGQPCADSISQILKPTYTSVSENANTLNLNTHKTLQQPKESVSVKPVPKKSRWDVYLEQQPTSHTEDIENDSEDLSLITNAPDERHCSLTSLDFLSSNGNNQEEINVENDIKNSKYVDMPMETHESNASSGFLNRQLNKNLMLSNSHQLPEMPPMISTTPVVQTCGVEKPVTKYQRPQQFSFKPLQTITMSNMSENGTFQNKVADPNGFSTSEIHICNVVSSAQLFPKSDLVEDNPEQDKPIASDNPAVAELDELSSQNESKDEAFAEVTFNLLDSFEFADSDEEIPQGDILVPQSAPHLSKSCSDIDKNKSCAGDITVKKGKDQSNLGCYDSLHNENKSVPSKNIIVKEMESSLAVSNESDVVRTECQLRHVPLTSTNYTNSCSQGTRKVEHDSGFQTFGLVSNNVATTKNEQCATYLHAFKDCEFSSDIDILDDSELISSSLDVQETTEHIEQVSKKDDILLDNGEDFLENVQIGQKSLQTSNTPQQWSLPSSNDMFDCVAEESRSSPLSKQCDPDLEHDLQHLDEFVGSNESNTGSSEVSHSLSSISLLKTLTKPNTALESLNILNVKTHSAPQEREGAKPEPTSSEEEEVLHRPSTTGPYQTEISFTPESTLVVAPWSGLAEKPYCHHPASPELTPVLYNEQHFDINGPSISIQAGQPVQFQGHRVKGSASSAVMLRAPEQVLEWNKSPVQNVYWDLQYEPPCLHQTPQLLTDYMLTDFIQPSPKVDTVTCFETNEDFQTMSDLIPQPLDNGNSVSIPRRLQPQWMGNTQRSDCDWELSQWPSIEANKVNSQTQQDSPNVDCPFFLRSRAANGEENNRIVLNDFISSDQGAEGLNIAAVSKRFRLRASLEKRVPLVTGPEIPLCSNFSEENSAYSIQNTHQHSIPSMENNCGSPSKICPVIENREDYIFTEFIGEHSDSLDFIENASVSTHKRQSKWSKYQNTSDDFQNKEDRKEAEEFCAQSVFGKSHYAIEERQSNDMNISESEQLHSLKDTCGYEKSKDTVSRLKLLTKQLATVNTPLPHLGKPRLSSPVTEEGQQVLLSGDLRFPSRDTVLSVSSLKREVQIPTVFHSPAHYKQAFTAALTEHLNILMFDLSQRLHKAISKVDISFYTSSSIEVAKSNENVSPFCLHRQPAKLVMVKKEGQNKGRFFYTCDAPKSDQCKFFKWLEELKGTNPVQGKSEPKPVFGDVKSLASYVRCQKVPLYEESQLMIRKKCGFQKRRFGKFRKFADDDSEFGDSKTKLYLKLSRKEHSSTYSKDDIWVVSKTLIFDPQDTFIACSAFFGPSANNDIEILPLKGYYPSNWPSNMVVHALLVCNASTELTSLRNIQEHFNVATLPIMPYLLKMCAEPEKMNKVGRGKFNPPSSSVKVSPKSKLPSCDLTLGLAVQMIQQFSLNEHQAAALVQIAQMMSASEEPQEQQTLPVTIIHGVFGAGKSYLLAVVVLFLVQLFESIDVADGQHSTPWKLLISSSTNVAVDRVLLGLLDLGFDRFIRVGSVRKIAKPILPYSLHAGSDNDNEQLKELLALLKDDLTQAEKAYVRKSIEQHKLGTNKMLLGQFPVIYFLSWEETECREILYLPYRNLTTINASASIGCNKMLIILQGHALLSQKLQALDSVSVVGATCAACPFACLSNLKFPLVILDECSQMTEPASLLPIARFQCGKLILVGDPKQLSPSIQGSEAAHERGLEQTLFNRLCLMGHKTIMLRTQYRCHPVISAIANELFYEGHLLNGISEDDRRPLLDWLPTLCFYNVNGTEQMEGNNSFQNTEEAVFTMKLIQSLIASGVQGSMIGVITLYKSQMHKLCSLLASSELYDPMEVKAVQVSTVDAFQGAEKEIIVLSCVRTRQVGFIDSEKRMNVALTRGKRHLLIVGNLACLRKSTMWENVIHHCQSDTL